LAEGEGVEELLGGDVVWGERERDDLGKGNLGFYENWVKA
jgi:hypothetical protein